MTDVSEIEQRLEDGRLLRLLVAEGLPPEVLLLHGTTDSADSYRPLFGHIASRHRVTAVHLRGHGGSDPAGSYELHDYAADIITLLERRQSRPAILVGHSLGAMVAMFIASTRPELVAGVVLEDPPYFALLDAERNHQAPWYGAWIRLRELLEEQLDAEEFDARVADLPAMIPGAPLRLGDVLDEPALAARASVLRQVDPSVLDPVIADRLLSAFPARALQVRCPAALIAGSWRLGGAMTDDDLSRWVGHVPEGTVTILGRVGHLIHHDAASRRAVLWHLQEIARDWC